MNGEKTLALVIAIVTLLIVKSFETLHVLSMPSETGEDVKLIASSFSMERIMNHVRVLSSFGTRFTGSNGFYKAAKYIENTLRSYGIEVVKEGFTITVPIVEICEARALLEKKWIEVKLYPLLPNNVCTSSYKSPQNGDEVIYVSDINDLRSKNISERIVLLEYNTRYLWKLACIMRAKGVIFIEPMETTYAECLLKVLNIPLPFPRFYILREDGLKLKSFILRGKRVRVWINCKVIWKNVKVYNIVGRIKGADPLLSGEVMVLAAHYDSWSPVMGIAPGATDAIGLSFLLELARTFSLIRPKRTVWIVALAAHYQYLWGGREFVEKHFRELGLYVKGFISLDLASDSEYLGLYVTGLGYGFISPNSLISQQYTWIIRTFFGEWLELARKAFGRDYNVLDLVTYSYPEWVKLSQPLAPPYLYLESEPFTVACWGGGLSFVTTNSLRIRQRTMFDVVEAIKLEKLLPQLEYLWIVLYEYVNMELRYVLSPTRLYSDWGYVTLEVQLAKYNVSTAWYSNFSSPNALVVVSAYNNPPNSKWIARGFTLILKPDESGRCLIHGLKPYSTVYVEGYVLNDDYNRMTYATDTGVYGLPKAVTLTVSKAFKLTPLFECATIYVLQPVNPQSLKVEIKRVDILNFLSHTALIHRDFISRGLSKLDICEQNIVDIVAFVEPLTPVEVIVKSDEPHPVIILINASEVAPLGKGFRLKKGEYFITSPIDYARDIFFLASSRARTLVNRGVISADLKEYYLLMEYYSKSFIKRLREGNLAEAYRVSFMLWSYARSVYRASMMHINDVILTALLIVLILVPFSIGVERLIFSSSGLKRVLIIAAIYIIGITSFSLVHPGFHIATNISILSIASSVVMLLVALAVMLMSDAYSQVKRVREVMIGKHFMEIERLGLFITAFSTGIRNMKKRKLRTGLTILSVIISVFALTAYTSITMGVSIAVKSLGRAPYTGILIERAPWIIEYPLPEELMIELKLLFGDKYYISPKTWIYLPGRQLLYHWNASKTHPIRGIIGINSVLLRGLGIDKLPPKGVYLTEGRVYSCAIPVDVIRSLSEVSGMNYSTGFRLTIWGVELTITSAYEGNALWSGEGGVIDLDRMSVTPVDVQEETIGYFRRISGNEVLIVPFTTIQYLTNALPISISLIPKDEVNKEELYSLALNLSKRFMTDVYYGYSEKSWIISPRIQYMIGGLETLIVPMVIVGLTILSTMLGSVYERTKEMQTYSALGLAPTHIVGMFLAESLIHGLIGSVIGYMIGTVFIYASWYMRIYPEYFYPNYASMAVLVIMFTTILFTIMSALYPAYKASTLVTPSFERKWRIETKPLGNVWSLPLPFLASRNEVFGVFEFLREYFEAHSLERMGLFSIDGSFRYTEIHEGSELIYAMKTRVRLAPFDQGIVQEIELVAQRRGDTYSFEIVTRKIHGADVPWRSSNSAFFREIRKQLLIWRSLNQQEREKYIRKGIMRFKE